MEFALTDYQSNFHPKPLFRRFNITQKVPQNYILQQIEDNIDFDSIIHFSILRLIRPCGMLLSNEHEDESITG
jgi:hypothetical protein